MWQYKFYNMSVDNEILRRMEWKFYGGSVWNKILTCKLGKRKK